MFWCLVLCFCLCTGFSVCRCLCSCRCLCNRFVTVGVTVCEGVLVYVGD